MTTSLIVAPFPAPPQVIRRALDHLQQAQDAGLTPAAVRRLDRPWEPATCSAQVRAALWLWLDDVAAWLNHTYAWQTAHAVPSCWPGHPHLVSELAVLASVRAAASDTATPQALEEWHRYVLPAFLARTAERLGVGCPPGRHADWPARAWAAEYGSDSASAARRALFDSDLTAVDHVPVSAGGRS